MVLVIGRQGILVNRRMVTQRKYATTHLWYVISFSIFIYADVAVCNVGRP